MGIFNFYPFSFYRAALGLGCSALALAAAANAAQRRRLDQRQLPARNDDHISGRWPGRGPGRGRATAIPGDAQRFRTAPSTRSGTTRPSTISSASPRRSRFRTSASTSAKLLASETLPTNLVVTSFSSKSELGLSIARNGQRSGRDLHGLCARRCGLSAIVAGCLTCRTRTAPRTWTQPTSLSQFYTSAYTDLAFNRSVVAVGANGNFYDHPDSRLWRRQQPGRRAGAERPLLYGRQLQQRHRPRRRS